MHDGGVGEGVVESGRVLSFSGSCVSWVVNLRRGGVGVERTKKGVVPVKEKGLLAGTIGSKSTFKS